MQLKTNNKACSVKKKTKLLLITKEQNNGKQPHLQGSLPTKRPL